ncbi:SLC13/DASS family transporter [Sphingomonas sp. ID1715]|uniref:SLC13 family permease n=1 Tax=Sphingomonas sp. ID1715 TaxID=1656898 RepID=UPI0014899037|nr:SLC13/DASS family transporter [Sphingomonas sp. ID1715]
MTLAQAITLAVLAGVVIALIVDKGRPEVVALLGAAVLLMTGAIKPREVQSAFASPAIIALASLFVISYAMERSGLLDLVARGGVRLGRALGRLGMWIVVLTCGGASAFLNNSPIVILAAPVVSDVARGIGEPPKRYLMPLSYITVLGGCCTLIGTSTNLLVNDMARAAGHPGFGIFEIAPVGLAIAAAGAIYLLLFSNHLGRDAEATEPRPAATLADTANVGRADIFAPERPLHPWRAAFSLATFIAAVGLAAAGVAPIAATAFAGAVVLIATGVIEPDEAYAGLRPDVLLLIAGMVIIGLALEQTGLAETATRALSQLLLPLSPFWALVIFYGATLILTEILSNATVAVLLTPVAMALAETIGVSSTPFIVATMMAGSAAFATPFGYQTNTIVYRMGQYRYLDFVRFGLPLNLLTWLVGSLTIPIWFPF